MLLLKTAKDIIYKSHYYVKFADIFMIFVKFFSIKFEMCRIYNVYTLHILHLFYYIWTRFKMVPVKCEPGLITYLSRSIKWTILYKYCIILTE